MGIKKRLFPGCFETLNDFANKYIRKSYQEPLKKGQKAEKFQLKLDNVFAVTFRSTFMQTVLETRNSRFFEGKCFWDILVLIVTFECMCSKSLYQSPFNSFRFSENNLIEIQ
jgi:hypothetical protein